MQTNGFRCENGSHTPGKSFLWSLAMSYIHILNPRPNKFLQSPSVILQRVRRHQPTPEELAASLERNRVRHGVPTAVDRWISAALNTSPPRATSGASSAQAMAVPTLADLLEDLVECQLSKTETEVSYSLRRFQLYLI